MKPAPGGAVALNAICPYFTMFPLDFPLHILQRSAKEHERVLDPFCGRGTTNFAARLMGLSSSGIDSSPIAAAISAAKLVTAHPADIVSEARHILDVGAHAETPHGSFWSSAFHPQVLRSLCRLRASLLEDCSSPVRLALRGIILGALHGPVQKTFQSYLSNQCPRTYAPKPKYAVRYWRRHKLGPPAVDVQTVIRRRAYRYYSADLPVCGGEVRLGDSRSSHLVTSFGTSVTFDWVITSPPYYGMRTYIPDQWLRHWFVGGPAAVEYSVPEQISHASPEAFSRELRQVWSNVARVCRDGARCVIRFGGIRDRNRDPVELIRNSLSGTSWRLVTVREAGTARHGKRQADSFLRSRSKPVAEYDFWTRAC